MGQHLEAGADTGAGETKALLLGRQRIVNAHHPAVGECVEPPLRLARAVLVRFADQRRAAVFDGAEHAVVAERRAFEVSAGRVEPAAGNLFVVDQRLAGQLALDFGIELRSILEVAGVGQVAADIDITAVRVVAFVGVVLRAAAQPAQVEIQPDVPFGEALVPEP